MALGFYERVVVVRSNTFPDLIGRAGHVLGISEESGTVCGYSVLLVGAVECCFFQPNELEGSGEFADKDLFYDGDSIRVRVTGCKGHPSD
jgi:hypothetical protein